MLSESLNQSFAIKDQLRIVEGKGGFPIIEIENEYASALVSIYGAQVLSFKLKFKNAEYVQVEENDLFFVSESAYFEQGKAIKGGIPICWPWFGRDEENPDRQMHGFARNMLWQLDETSSTSSGETKIVLSLKESTETLKLWPHKFKLVAVINIGKTLEISLKTTNTGKSNFKITQAIHSYFALANIDKARVEGLDKTNYLDKVKGAKEAVLQKGDVRVSEEVDRIYIDSPSRLSLFDEQLQRELVVNSSGSKTTVIWNPWVDISKRSADLSDDAYLEFICVETANAAKDTIVIEPNDSHTIGVEYTVK